jgi:hypothetical protein
MMVGSGYVNMYPSDPYESRFFSIKNVFLVFIEILKNFGRVSKIIYFF